MKSRSSLRCLLFASAGVGCASLCFLRAADNTERIVELPPIEVTVDAKPGRPWTYVEIPETEVLSRCSPRVTREFLEAQFRLDQLLRIILPADLCVPLSVPRTLILNEASSRSDLSQNVVSGRLGGAPAPQSAGPPRPAPRVRYLANLRLDDVDGIAVYALVDEDTFSGAAMELSPEYVRFRLERRAPRLPVWFFSGFLDVFGGMGFTERAITFDPVAWTSKEETERIRVDADYPATLLPMEDVLARPCPEPRGDTLESARIWRAQAALFVRWMIEEPTRRAQLAKLAARGAEQPITDAMCLELLGYDYSGLRDQMNDYLHDAVRRGVNLKVADLPKLPEIKPHAATPAEIGRTKGDWDRLEITWVRARQPDFVAAYTAQARRTLTQANTVSNGDPRVAAILGLLECDLANDEAALPQLEIAAAAKVVRPRVYYELARIRYEAALKTLSSPDALLNARQVNAVLEPFKVGNMQQPPLRAAYRLITEAWSRSTADLGPTQLAFCDEGVRLFPEDSSLLYNVAVLKMMHGAAHEGAALAQRGLTFAETPMARARFEKIIRFASQAEPASVTVPRVNAP